MAKTRSLEVVISGDPKQLNRAFGNIDRSAANTEGRLKRMGKVGALAFGGLATAAAGAAVIGLKKSADAAIEAEKAQARMTTQLKASGISYRAHAKEIDNVIQKTSRLSGLDDEDLQDSFTNIVRVTGDVNKSLKLTGLAADFARAKHMDVAKAGELVGKVAGGNVGVLSRYGIQIDKNATSSEALAELQKRFSGQAEAYGKTTAGSMERAGVAAENLGEAVGAKLAPLVAKGADALTNLIDRSGQAAGPIRRITGTIANAYNTVRNAVTRFARTNREDIAAVVSAVRNLGRFFKNVFEDVILPAVRAALPGVRQALNGIITVVRGIVRVVSGIINGDWRRVWAGLKDIVRGAINGVVGVVRAAVGGIGTALVNAGKGLGKAIVRGIVSAFTGIGSAIGDKLKGAVGALNPFGDGLGKQIGEGLGKIPSLAPLPTPRAGGASGSLMGADSALAPFAAIGARFGLHVSSGKRAPGRRTSSGGISFHGSGEAVDLANGRGPDQAKLSAFTTLKSRFGSRLAELIYTPGGVGVKNGRPFTYTGQVAADHFDHVHVALDLGRPGPGIGDGMGRAAFTGDGPGGNVRTVWQFLRGHGMTPAQAAGIIGVMQGESGQGLSTTATNPKSGAYGIAQWLGGRKAALMAKSNPSSLQTQLQHLWSELQGPERGAYARIKRAHTINEAVNAWLFGFERPGPNEANLPARTANAQRVFAALQRVGAGTSTGATRGGGGGSTATPDTTSPYELAIAGSDVEIAEAQQGGSGPATGGVGGRSVFGTSTPAKREIGAQRNRLSLVNKRIKAIRKGLKRKGLRPATKLRLRQELASLLGERSTITGRIDELAQLPEAADSGAAEATEPVTELDRINAMLAQADLTPDKADDQAAAQALGSLRSREYQYALGTGDPRKIAEAAQNLKTATDAIGSLNDALAEQLQAVKDHTDALRGVQSELKRQTDFATAVQATEAFQLKKYLADLISGQVGAFGVAPRSYTPGTGVAHVY